MMIPLIADWFVCIFSFLMHTEWFYPRVFQAANYINYIRDCVALLEKVPAFDAELF